MACDGVAIAELLAHDGQRGCGVGCGVVAGAVCVVARAQRAAKFWAETGKTVKVRR